MDVIMDSALRPVVIPGLRALHGGLFPLFFIPIIVSNSVLVIILMNGLDAGDREVYSFKRFWFSSSFVR